MSRVFTERGFEDFIEFRDSYNSKIVIRESSAVGEPHVWIFCKDNPNIPEPSPYLNVEQAKKVIDGLLAFIDRTESEN